MSGTGETVVGVRIDVEAGSSKEELASVAQAEQKIGQEAATAAGELDAAAQALEEVGAAGAPALEEVGAAAVEAAEAVSNVGKSATQTATQGVVQVDALAQAYSTLGITSTAALEKAADTASAAFTTIRESATATATDVNAAFQKMAEAEIAAAAAVGDARAEEVAGALEANAETETQLAIVGALREQYVALGQTAAEAFQALGVQSTASLQEAATAARAAFQTIQESGQATATDLNAAFRAVADAELQAAAAAGEAAAAAAAGALRAEAATEEQRAAVAALAAQYTESGAAAEAAGEKAKAGIGLVGSALGALLGISIGAEVVKQLADVADEANNLTARLKLATDSQEAFQIASDGVRQIAEKTGTSLEGTAELYYKLAQAVQVTGGNQQDTLTVTKAITEAIQLSGVSAQTATNGIIQFSQGLAAGTLQGQDLRAVLEDIPSLGKAIADGLGVTVAQLRQLAEQGELTPQQILAALEKVAPQIAEKFAVVPQTVGRALTDLKTAFIEMVGGVDQTTAASATLAGVIEDVAKSIEAFGANPAVREAFSAIGSAFKLLVVDQIQEGGDAISLAFHSLQAVADEAAAAIAYAFSKITFGDTSKAFAEAADSLQQSASEAATKVQADFGNLSKDLQTQASDAVKSLKSAGSAFVDMATNAQAAATATKGAAAAATDGGHTYEDLAAKAKAAAAVFSGDLPAALAKLVDGFGKTQGTAGAAGESIGTFVDHCKDAKLGTDQVIAGLAALDAKGAISAQQFKEGLGKALQDVAIEDLPPLIKALQVDYANAVDTASVKTTALKQALQAAQEDGFKKLGLESPEQLQKVAAATQQLFDMIKTQYPQATGLIADAYAKMADAQLKAAAAGSETQLEITAANLKAQASTQAESDALDALIQKYPQLAAAAASAGGVQQQTADELTNSYNQLLQQINQAGDVDTLNSLKKQLTDTYAAGEIGAEQYTAAIEAAKQKEDQLAQAAQGIAAAIANTVNTAYAYYKSLSDQAADDFNAYTRNIIHEGEPVEEYWNDLAKAVDSLNQRVKEQTSQADDLLQKLTSVGGATESNLRYAQQLASTFNYVDSQTFSNLKDAISQVQQQIDSLDASAQQTLTDLQQQLYQLQGNTQALDDLQNAQKEADIKGQIAQAQAAGDSKAVQQLEQALQTLEQIAALQKEQNTAAQQQNTVNTAPPVLGRYEIDFTTANGQKSTLYSDSLTDAQAIVAALSGAQNVSISGG